MREELLMARDVFIGTGTNIIEDVRVGDNVIIAQNCVIVKDIAAGTTVVAQPPRIIGAHS